ncbi:hypothetical protein CONPUDRAFT_155687 [Coniophora puteana RWD-64-598 SS2]|uniref:F-box domain-containing protein n=1 Tax=Coniophora puteana (strain RWD-64-598) TaxID=741705 RepID=A0A5M3MIG6_CONPW|nr:uncharacterized protein CONPUDRAFT_155687 [Coniophora puteana RWD-64-598 SS2]EIW79002.1 hypothetical protein CONPUDRAFT_155687 [Coniophora puteana RWD-64-598 SS2]
MGKVTVFCIISGCTPESADNLSAYTEYYADSYEYEQDEDEEADKLNRDEVDDSRGKLGPLTLQAIRELAEEEEDINDVTAIGDFVKAPQQDPGGGIPKAEALEIPDSAITVLRHCKAGGDWEFGSVDGLGNSSYLVSFGVLIMVQDFALPILHLATRGRVTPQRLWRLAMHQGHSDLSGGGSSGLDDVDYGEINDEREQFPLPIPNMKCREVKELEKFGDVQKIKDGIAQRGGYWMWMRADRFPLGNIGEGSIPSFASPNVPPTSANASAVEKLPLELLHMIVLLGPLTSLLSLASTSRSMRSILFGSEDNCNTLAIAWITHNAPWFVPPTSDMESQDEMHKIQHAWTYLQRCCTSPSMRNRARIWKVAERIEDVAVQSGV